MKFKSFYLKYKNDYFAAIFLCLICVFYFRKIIFNNRMVYGSDLLLQFKAWRFFGFSRLLNGKIPLWNPNLFMGSPFVAGMQSALFYPLNFIFLIFPIDVAINLSVFIHFILFGIFMYIFCKVLFKQIIPSLISAITFMLSTFHVYHLYAGHLPHLCAICWLPFIFIFIERFWQTKDKINLLIAGIGLSMQILAGYPPFVFITIFAVIFYHCYRNLLELKSFKKITFKAFYQCIFYLLIVVLFGAFLSSIQLIPFLEFACNSNRTLNHDLEFSTVCSLPPENLISIIVPGIFGHYDYAPFLAAPHHKDFIKQRYWGRWLLWEMGIYMGIFPFILSLIALINPTDKKEYFWWILAISSLLMSMGKYTPIYKFASFIIPGLYLLRVPARFLLLYIFSLSILTGLGSQILLNPLKSKSKKTLKKIIGITTLIMCILVIFAIFCKYEINKNNFKNWTKIVEVIHEKGERFVSISSVVKNPDFLYHSINLAMKSIVRAVFFLLLSIATILFIYYKMGDKKGIGAIILLVIIIDLFSFGDKYINISGFDNDIWGKETIEFLQKEQDPFRIISLLDTSSLNHGMFYNISHIGGYDASILRRYNEIINFIQNQPLNRILTISNITNYSKLLDLFNLKYILTPNDMNLIGSNIELVFTNDQINIFKNMTSFPRSFIVHNYEIITNTNEILNRMASDDFCLNETIILEQPPEIPFKVKKKYYGEEVEIKKYTMHEVRMACTLKEKGFLLLSDTFYPGWMVYVDSRRDKIYQANYLFRSVFLDKGSHEIIFVYDPLSFKIGLWINLFSFLGVLIFLFWGCVRRKLFLPKL